MPGGRVWGDEVRV